MGSLYRKKGTSVHSKQYSLIEGSIWKGMLLFAMPVFLGNLFQQLYNAFDAWCVGNYIGDTALAAVSSSGNLIFLMVSFFNGVSMGAGVIIAREFGAKRYDAMDTVKAFLAWRFSAVLWDASTQMEISWSSLIPPQAAFMALGVPSAL